MTVDFLLKPVLSEKALMDQERGVYHFWVWQKANRHQIKQEVENFFSVKVDKVNTLNLKGKTKTSRRKRTKHRLCNRKKAMVFLKEGEKIKQLLVGKEKKRG